MVECAREEEGTRLEGLACGALRQPQREKVCLLRCPFGGSVHYSTNSSGIDSDCAVSSIYPGLVPKSESSHAPVDLSISLHVASTRSDSSLNSSPFHTTPASIQAQTPACPFRFSGRASPPLIPTFPPIPHHISLATNSRGKLTYGHGLTQSTSVRPCSPYGNVTLTASNETSSSEVPHSSANVLMMLGSLLS